MPFGIYYPGSDLKRRPPRQWILNLPNLERAGQKGDYCYEKINCLLKPEIPGNHVLVIYNTHTPTGEDYVQYAGYHGLTDREYAIMEGEWRVSFHVSSKHEYTTIIIISLTLIVSITTAVVAIVN